jgi:murein DD-endopeptidase MepM/ murein hydrolase activator NlpD
MKSCKSYFSNNLILVTLIAMCFSSGISLYSQSAVLQSRYDQKKNEISSQLNTINSQIGNLSKDLDNIELQKASLVDQINTLRSEIKQTEELITQTKLAVSAIDGQIEENEKKLVELNSEMRDLIREIQRQEKTSPIEAILSSTSFGEALSSLYNLTTLDDKANEINLKLEEVAKELATNKKAQEDAQKSLESQQFLLNSKNDGLQFLLQQTQNEQAKYEALLAASRDQKKQSESQFIAVDAEYKAALEAELTASKANSYYSNGGSDYGYAEGGSNCRWSETRALTAPSGYFIRPTQAYVSQNYYCSNGGGHDAWDMANSQGTPIFAVADGKVAQKGFHPGGFGNYLVIRHDLPSGQRVYSLYAHMQSASPASGSVSQGQQVGAMGSTGLSTGPHLHFMLISDTFERGGVGCQYGGSKCWDPATFFKS